MSTRPELTSLREDGEAPGDSLEGSMQPQAQLAHAMPEPSGSANVEHLGHFPGGDEPFREGGARAGLEYQPSAAEVAAITERIAQSLPGVTSHLRTSRFEPEAASFRER